MSDERVSCDVIRDLLPLYYDDVCSDDTKKMIDEHLDTCDECRAYLNDLKAVVSDSQQPVINKEKAKKDALKGIRKKILRRNVIVGVCVFVLSAGVLFGGYTYIMHYDTPIACSEDLLTLESYDDAILAVHFNGNDYYGYYETNKYFEKDGKLIHAMYFCYTDTVWTRNFSKKNMKNDLTFVLSKPKYEGEDNSVQRSTLDSDITQIYYLPADYNELERLTDAEWEEATKDDATLIWES